MASKKVFVSLGHIRYQISNREDVDLTQPLQVKQHRLQTGRDRLFRADSREIPALQADICETSGFFFIFTEDLHQSQLGLD